MVVSIVASDLNIRGAIRVDKAKIFLFIAIIVSTFTLSNQVSAKDSDGLIVMELQRPGINRFEDIKITCSYFDNLNNIRRDDSWSVTVPIGPHVEVRLKVVDRDLKIQEPSRRIPIIDPGPVTYWTIKPYSGGKYKFILEYFINGKPYSKPSDYIKI